MSRRRFLDVSLLSHSTWVPVYRNQHDDDWHPRSDLLMGPRGDTSAHGQLQTILEFAGRGCYESFDRPNEATGTNHLYLQNILDQVHYSVLEHATVSFYIEGVSRSLTHELVRHRHFSYSQLSQRFVPASKMGFVAPPAVANDPVMVETMEDSFERALEEYENWIDKLRIQGGFTNKQVREAARAVLPNMTETRLTITGNLRSWIEFVIKRDHPAADAEIQQLAAVIGGELAVLAPSIFGSEGRAKWDPQGVAQGGTTR